MRLLLLMLILLPLSGCTMNMGSVPAIAWEEGSEGEPASPVVVEDAKCVGVAFTFGNAEGACGMKSGGLTIPGATLLGKVMQGIQQIGGAFLGHDTGPPPSYNLTIDTSGETPEEGNWDTE